MLIEVKPETTVDADFSEAQPVRRSDPDEAAPADALQSKRVALLLLGGLSLVFLTSVLFRPSGDPYGEYFTVCAFKNLTGLPCPGCGLTHSFCAMGRGDLLSAFGFNLLGPPLYLLALLFWVRSLSVLWDWGRSTLLLDRLLAWFRPVRTFAIAFAVFGVARIVYVIFYRPGVFDLSPLARLAARIFH